MAAAFDGTVIAATPNNRGTRPRWRSSACFAANDAIDLTLAPKYAAMTLEHEAE
jgi:hypothetical protein